MTDKAPSIRELSGEGAWDALTPDNGRLYTLSTRFSLNSWRLEFRTFWGRRTHGRQGYLDRAGNFVFCGYFE
jgi:hypothetical protein